jgi:hypothetical protein
VVARGAVETSETAGIAGPHTGPAPLWLFSEPTELTEAGENVRGLLGGIDSSDGVDALHESAARILAHAPYEFGTTEVTSTAEEALEAGIGVCQDHAHIFVAAARTFGIPARYVSGYLMRDDTEEQDAGHAWAQAWVDPLGWVGFDHSNGISPDERYVQVAITVVPRRSQDCGPARDRQHWKSCCRSSSDLLRWPTSQQGPGVHVGHSYQQWYRQHLGVPQDIPAEHARRTSHHYSCRPESRHNPVGRQSC